MVLPGTRPMKPAFILSEDSTPLMTWLPLTGSLFLKLPPCEHYHHGGTKLPIHDTVGNMLLSCSNLSTQYPMVKKGLHFLIHFCAHRHWGFSQCLQITNSGLVSNIDMFPCQYEHKTSPARTVFSSSTHIGIFLKNMHLVFFHSCVFSSFTSICLVILCAFSFFWQVRHAISIL